MTRSDASWTQPGNGVAVSIGIVFYTNVTRYIERHGAQGAIDDFVGLMPWGTPDMILEKFENMAKMIGMNGVMPGFSYGGMPYADAEASLRLFAQQCLPELQSWKTPPLAMPALQGVG